MTTVYKIKSTKTGLYSKGGGSPTFTKNGKAWTNIGHLKNHINVLDRYGKDTYKKEQVVIESYEIVEVNQTITSFDDFLAEMKENQAVKKAVHDEKIRARVEESRRREYERLKREFEPDTSDIPEITDWSKAKVGKFYNK